MRTEPGASRRDKRRAAMLEAAHHLFLERGYGTTTLGEVVKRSGGSLATLYHLFEGKEGLFRAVVAEQCALIADSLEQAEMADLAPEQALRRFAERIMEVVLSKDNIALLRQVIAEACQFPELGRTLFATGVETLHAKVEDYLRRQTARGLLAVDEPAVVAVIFSEMVIQQYRLKLLCGVPVSLTPAERDRHIDRVLAVFLRAYGASSANGG